MKIKKAKILYLILALSILIFTSLMFSSCGTNDAGREIFSPESGEYEIMLIPGEWTAVPDFNRSADDLTFTHISSGTLVFIECYIKTNASAAGINDLNGFIEYYKALETGRNPYTAGTDINIENLTDIKKSEFKNTVISSGKAQKISAKYVKSGTEDTEDVITSVIYLESANHYFAVYCSVTPDKLESAQTGANDLISHIRKEK